jgi:hypothetical protein
MKRDNMVILKIDLDEGFPVVIAFVDFNMIEHISVKLEIACNTEFGEIGANITRNALMTDPP